MKPRLAALLLLTGLLENSLLASPFAVTANVSRAESGTPLLSVAFGVPPGSFLYADRITVESSGAALAPGVMPPAHKKADPESGEAVFGYDHDVTLTYPLPAGVSFPLMVRVRFQGCSDTLCFLPDTRDFTLDKAILPARAPEEAGKGGVAGSGGHGRNPEGFVVVGKAAGYLNTEAFLRFLDRVETGRGSEEDVSLTDTLRRKGTIPVILLILLGGVLLNFTPCVLPMIPVNIAIIGAGAAAGSRRRGLALGGAYGLGIAMVYGALGLIVILTGSRFGSLNASPWFNLAIAAVFVVMALAMFGVINVDFSRFQGGAGAGGGRGRLLTSFVLGGMAALLAGACVAPVLISVLLLAADLHARGIAAGALLPFVLGLGMGLPWPLAGAGLSFLPKPGGWMEKVKYGFGVLILAFAAWYGYLGYTLLARHVEPAETHGGEFTSLEQGMRESTASGKPLFVDLWANWCKNCLEMDRTTFKDPKVAARLDGYVRVKFNAEDMSSPGVKEVLDRFEVIGLPTYLVLKPERTR